MANTDHENVLNLGGASWNDWRSKNPDIKPNLSGVVLSPSVSLDGADLTDSDLSRARLAGVSLIAARLCGANLSYADLHRAQMRGAILTGANLHRAGLWLTNLSDAKLQEADLTEANLDRTDLTRADLTLADLRGARVQQAKFHRAILVKCKIYGVSPWDSDFSKAKQTDLEVSQKGANPITVDNIEAAHFVYLMLNNQKIGGALDTIARKVVLILGRFSPQRKRVLEAIRRELRKQGYVPVIFDFERTGADLTQTVRTLADVSRFVIADITEPRSVAHELQEIVPATPIPVQPILEEASGETYALFGDLQRRYHWVLPVLHYKGVEDLLRAVKERIIDPAESKVKELGRPL